MNKSKFSRIILGVLAFTICIQSIQASVDSSSAMSCAALAIEVSVFAIKASVVSIAICCAVCSVVGAAVVVPIAIKAVTLAKPLATSAFKCSQYMVHNYPYPSLAVSGAGILAGLFLFKKHNKDNIFVLDPSLKTGQFIAIRSKDGIDVFKRIKDEQAAAREVRDNKYTDIVIYDVTVDHSKKSLHLRHITSTEKNSWVHQTLC